MDFKKIIAAIIGFFRGLDDGTNKPEAKIPEQIKESFTSPKLTDYEWGVEAEKERNQSEVSGSKDNPRIVAWYKEVVGKVYHDETANCMAFIMCMLKRAGYKYKETLWAADLRKVGKPCELKVGALVGKKSKVANSGIHATICEAIDEKNGVFYGFGANQGNKTQTSKFPIKDVAFCVWPEKA